MLCFVLINNVLLHLLCVLSDRRFVLVVGLTVAVSNKNRVQALLDIADLSS